MTYPMNHHSAPNWFAAAIAAAALALGLFSCQPVAAATSRTTCTQDLTFALKLVDENVSPEELFAYVEEINPSARDREIWESIGRDAIESADRLGRPFNHEEIVYFLGLIGTACYNAKGV